MYRTLFPLLLCMNAATPAPQLKSDSDVTFVKIQPVLDDTAPEVTNKRRESRTENVPLIIPENIDGTSDDTISDDKPSYDTPSDVTVSDSSPSGDIISDGTLTKPTDDSVSDGILTKPTDDTVSDELLPDLAVQNTKVSEQKTDLVESDLVTEKSDIVPQETQSRQGRNYHSDETTESFEIATEKYEEVTEIQKPLNYPPKLSYFPKNNDRFSTNLIEKSFKRQFRSRCRCEKIWNCPKLQISVPRCPDEYFLCCF